MCYKPSRLSVNCVWHSRWGHANKIYLRKSESIYNIQAMSAIPNTACTSHTRSLKLQTTAIYRMWHCSINKHLHRKPKLEKNQTEIMRFVVCRFLSAQRSLCGRCVTYFFFFARALLRNTHVSDKTTLHKKFNDSSVAFAQISSHIIKFLFRRFIPKKTHILISEFKAPHKHQQQRNAECWITQTEREEKICIYIFGMCTANDEPNKLENRI